MQNFTILTLLLAAGTASADILTNTNRFLGGSSPDYDPGEFVPDQISQNSVRAPFSPADSDFGVQQILGTSEGRPRINFFTNLDVNFTENAPAATRAQEDESFFFSALVGANWQPMIGNGWFADLGVVQEIYEFESDNAIDFANLQIHAGLVKSFVDLDDAVFFTRYEYQRLTSASWTDTDYSAQRIRAGLQKALFTRSRHEVAAGISAAFDLDANPETLERIEYAAELSYTYWIREDLSASVSWVGAYWKFDQLDRSDWNHTANLQLAWQFAPRASLYTEVSYSNNDSNTPGGVNDFEAWGVGAGIGLTVSF